MTFGAVCFCSDRILSFVLVISFGQNTLHMKNAYYLLFFAVVLLTSCKEDEVPQSFLNGTYEHTGTHTDTGISYVSQYIFDVDGTYERISLLREEGQLLGYNFYSKGTYTIRGEKFAVRDEQMAGVNHDNYPDGHVQSLDQLTDYVIEASESKGNLRRLDGESRIGIQMECTDLLLAMCMGEMIYDKVE